MSWKDRAVAVTEEDTGGGWKSRALPVQDSGPGAGQAALQHVGNALSWGYLPQVAGAAMKGVGYAADTLAGVPEDLRGGDSYTDARDATTRELEQGAKEHPWASAAGSLGGALVGGGVLSGGMGLLGRAAGIGEAASGGGRILRAVGGAGLAGGLMNPGDTEGELSGPQVGARLKNAGTGMLIGGLTQAGGEMLKKGVSALSPKGLDEFAETKALKAAGAAKSDFKTALQKGKVKDLGRTLLDENVDMTNPETGEVISQKLIQAGDKFEDIAKKSMALKQQAGSRIGNIYKQVQEKLEDPDFLKALSPEQFAQVKGLQINPKNMADELRSKLAQEFGESVDGPEVMDKVGKYVDRIWGKGDSISLQKLLKVKNEFDSKINFAKRTQDLSEMQQAYNLIRNHIRDTMNNLVSAVGQVAGDELGPQLTQANRLYDNASQLADMATAKLAGENANRMFGLTDTIAGSVGAGAGGSIGHAMGHGVEGAVLGAGAAVANKVGRTYGNGLMASGADTLSKGIKGMGATPLFDAAASGAGALAGSGALGPAGGLIQPSQKLHKGLIRDQDINRTLGSKK